MGGGDLNSKKSWHPNTLKNQERVWKVEQAAAVEKQRIVELQLERAVERDRAELNELAKRSAGPSSTSDHLHWMYEKPNKEAHQEDYLLGKAIDSKHDGVGKAQQDFIPAVARRVIGSSMLTTSENTQVDLARKLREDPLLLVKERERAARAALLNNPLQRRKLTELLRKEQEQKKENKMKNKTKKKDKNLDDMLASKLSTLEDKGVDIMTLLASDDSDSSSEGEKTKKRLKKKKSKKSKELLDSESKNEKRSKKSLTKEEKILEKYRSKPKFASRKRSHSSDFSIDRRREEDDQYDIIMMSKSTESNHYLNSSGGQKRCKTKHRERDSSPSEERRERRRSPLEGQKPIRKESRRSPLENRRKQSRSPTEEKRNPFERRKENHKVKEQNRSPTKDKRKDKYKKELLNSEERQARLAAMVQAGAERETQRAGRVAQQRADDQRDANAHASRRSRIEAQTLPDSLEDRIRSNRHYIQRDKRHMNEHFARR